MPKKGFVLAAICCLLILGALNPAWADVAFGPKEYVRTAGPPQIVTDTFSVADPTLSYKLVLTNNSLSDSITEAVSDSFIYLNDSPVLGTHNFTQGVNDLEIPVTLQADNKLEVEVRGIEGGTIIVQIVTSP